MMKERIEHHLGRATVTNRRQQDVKRHALYAQTRLLHNIRRHERQQIIGKTFRFAQMARTP
jgi:hypothetical protein